MPTRLLKVKSSIPYPLESRMVQKWGYVVEKREYQPDPYILLKKTYVVDKKTNDDGVKRTIRASVADNVVPINPKLRALAEGLSKWQCQQIEKRCDNIVNFFPDPYAVPLAVRARLSIVQHKMTPAESAFVQEYMDANFPV